jgi:hypothetical protein
VYRRLDYELFTPIFDDCDLQLPKAVKLHCGNEVAASGMIDFPEPNGPSSQELDQYLPPRAFAARRADPRQQLGCA